MTPEIIAALNAARDARRAVALAVRLSDARAFILPDPEAPEQLAAEASGLLAADRSGMITLGDESWFIEARHPKPRLILVGAVHIAQALAPLAALAGFDVVIVDPRTAFASAERFPGIATVAEWPDEALDHLRLDRSTAIVTLTHDPKLDDPALQRALGSDAFYIGALGSRKTHAGRVARLREAGFSEAGIARIRGPVGLAIGAVTAPEIALSIVAEIVAARRGGALAIRDAA
jgi:xanthine dehydrogenase accessory factor